MRSCVDHPFVLEAVQTSFEVKDSAVRLDEEDNVCFPGKTLEFGNFSISQGPIGVE